MMQSDPIDDALSTPSELRVHCPTCRRPLAGEKSCRRCGTDLRDLIRVVQHAWFLREEARRQILDGQFRDALVAAHKAQALHASVWGDRLDALARLGLEDGM